MDGEVVQDDRKYNGMSLKEAMDDALVKALLPFVGNGIWDDIVYEEVYPDVLIVTPLADRSAMTPSACQRRFRDLKFDYWLWTLAEATLWLEGPPQSPRSLKLFFEGVPLARRFEKTPFRLEKQLRWLLEPEDDKYGIGDGDGEEEDDEFADIPYDEPAPSNRESVHWIYQEVRELRFALKESNRIKTTPSPVQRAASVLFGGHFQGWAPDHLMIFASELANESTAEMWLAAPFEVQQAFLSNWLHRANVPVGVSSKPWGENRI